MFTPERQDNEAMSKSVRSDWRKETCPARWFEGHLELQIAHEKDTNPFEEGQMQGGAGGGGGVELKNKSAQIPQRNFGMFVTLVSSMPVVCCFKAASCPKANTTRSSVSDFSLFKNMLRFSW